MAANCFKEEIKMTLCELIDIAHKHTLTVNVSGIKGNYKVELMWIGYPSHMLDNGMVYAAHGRGNTLDEATEDFCNQISGKTLVFSPYELNRHEVELHI
jgi:hypothetical protein